MHRRTLLCALGLLLAAGQGVAAGPGAGGGGRRGVRLSQPPAERRVELRHAERASRLPCQVSTGATPRSRTAASRCGRPTTTTASASSRPGRCCSACRTRLVVPQAAARRARGRDHPGDRAARGVEALPAPKPQPDPGIVTERGKLDEALARDLSRLAELSAAGARFEIAAAELGDLDRDGDADAAVVLTYLTGQRQPAQFLMAYRFDGETFRPAAKTYLGRLDAGGRPAPSSASSKAPSSSGSSCRTRQRAFAVSGAPTCCRTTRCSGSRPRAEPPSRRSADRGFRLAAPPAWSGAARAAAGSGARAP